MLFAGWIAAAPKNIRQNQPLVLCPAPVCVWKTGPHTEEFAPETALL